MHDVLETAYHTGDNGNLARVNLGAGDYPAPGYMNLDRKTGHEAYPLDVPDNSLDQIRASHVLEHFSHGMTSAVLANWFSKLRPGGRLRVAVPNFEWIATEYLAGKPIPVQGYVMGGHKDEDDRHGAIFDRECLLEALIAAGFERISNWQPDAFDCSVLDCSLNLQGFKPTSDLKKLPRTVAFLSVPRYGPSTHFRWSMHAFEQLKIPYHAGQGAYWHQVLAELIEFGLSNPNTEYILTLDYDTVFQADDVRELYRLMQADLSCDAVAALQMKRGNQCFALFGMRDREGRGRSAVADVELSRNLLPVHTAHFGLTLFRACALRTLPRPWFVGQPNEEGRWTGNRHDPDIQFWHDWRANGKTVCIAPKVKVGHLVEAILWPDDNLEGVYQQSCDYETQGMPAACNAEGGQ